MRATGLILLRRAAIAVFLAVVPPSLGASLRPAAETGECSLEGALPATVAAVDEDFELLLDDGRRAVLAGLDFPPLDRRDLRAAIRSRLAGWLSGRDVFLGAFASTLALGQGPGENLHKPAEGGESTPLVSVAEALLLAGDARFRPDSTAAACAKTYLAAEARARDASAGLWSRPEFRPIDVSNSAAAADLNSRKGMIVVVGAIRSVGESRRSFYLNFGDKLRDSFTVVILRRNLANFGQFEPRSFVGRRARVRGLIETGSRIEIATPAEIEFLDGDASR